MKSLNNLFRGSVFRSATASPTRPPVVNSGDVIEIVRTPPAAVRIVNQFVCDLNEPGLLQRTPKYFTQAAADKNLIHAEIKRTWHVVACVSFIPGRHETNTTYELTGLVVHPDVRGFTLASILIKASMIYHLGQVADHNDEYIAHVLDGNEGPIAALTEVGFRFERKIELPRGVLGGALDHTITSDGNKIRGSEYRFDRAILNRLNDDMLAFLEGQSILTKGDISIEVRIDPSVVDPQALRYDREWREGRGR
jgi:Acetyltransferase (GNAT) family